MQTTTTTATFWDDAGKRWREMIEQQAELARGWADGQAKLAGTLADAGSGEADAAGGAAAMAELWRSWLTLGGSLGRAAVPGTVEPGRVAGETLGRLLDPMSLALVGGSQVGEAIRRLTEGPRLADLGAMERRMAKVTELWLAVQAAVRSHEAVVAGAWGEANKRFMAELGERHGAGEAPASPKDALTLWLDVANRTLLETHRSPRFLEAQGELLRRGMDFLLAERELVEALVEPAGLPTRSEIDEVHRSVQELKRRVRALERPGAARGTAAGLPPARPAEETKPARRRAGREGAQA